LQAPEGLQSEIAALYHCVWTELRVDLNSGRNSPNNKEEEWVGQRHSSEGSCDYLFANHLYP
jgi:hypothetical protein